MTINFDSIKSLANSFVSTNWVDKNARAAMRAEERGQYLLSRARLVVGGLIVTPKHIVEEALTGMLHFTVATLGYQASTLLAFLSGGKIKPNLKQYTLEEAGKHTWKAIGYMINCVATVVLGFVSPGRHVALLHKVGFAKFIDFKLKESEFSTKQYELAQKPLFGLTEDLKNTLNNEVVNKRLVRPFKKSADLHLDGQKRFNAMVVRHREADRQLFFQASAKPASNISTTYAGVAKRMVDSKPAFDTLLGGNNDSLSLGVLAELGISNKKPIWMQRLANKQAAIAQPILSNPATLPVPVMISSTSLTTTPVVSMTPVTPTALGSDAIIIPAPIFGPASAPVALRLDNNAAALIHIPLDNSAPAPIHIPVPVPVGNAPLDDNAPAPIHILPVLDGAAPAPAPALAIAIPGPGAIVPAQDPSLGVQVGNALLSSGKGVFQGLKASAYGVSAVNQVGTTILHTLLGNKEAAEASAKVFYGDVDGLINSTGHATGHGIDLAISGYSALSTGTKKVYAKLPAIDLANRSANLKVRSLGWLNRVKQGATALRNRMPSLSSVLSVELNDDEFPVI